MTRTRVSALLKSISVLVTLLASSCQPSAARLTFEIPEGFMAVTEAQRQLVTDVKALSPGMSPAEVKGRLGPPLEEKDGLLFYKLIEDRLEGGYYVSAALTFAKHGLTDAKLDFGHESRKPMFDE